LRYNEFKEAIRAELLAKPSGSTWKVLRDNLQLPYNNPCPTWIKRLEKEIELRRERGEGRALIWKLTK